MEKNQVILEKFEEYSRLVDIYNENVYELDLFRRVIAYLETLNGLVDQLEATIGDHYNWVLTKWPYLVDWWMRYIEFGLKIGLNRGVKFAQHGVELFPLSTTLWVKYIDLILDNGLHNGDDLFVRDLFTKLCLNCGYQFYSDQLWDKYLKWDSGRTVEILTKLVHIPLHQHSRYAAQLLELQSGDTVEIELEIDRVQLLVQLKWVYEQKITVNSFSLAPVPEQELQNWSLYLNYIESTNEKDLIISLYEQCLSICGLYENFWILYLKYLVLSDSPAVEIKSVVMRSLRIIPDNFYKVKVFYARYLISTGDTDQSYDILVNLVDKDISDHLLLTNKIDLDSFLDKVLLDQEPLEYWDRVTYKQKFISQLLRLKLAQLDSKRDLYMKFTEILSRDYDFWHYIITLELRDLEQLQILLDLVQRSQLPISQTTTLVSKIIQTQWQNDKPSITTILENDPLASFHYKHTLRNKTDFKDKDLVLSIANPGIMRNGIPTIISNNSANPPYLPSFRGVEKLNSSIAYPIAESI